MADLISIFSQDRNLHGNSTTYANWMSRLGLSSCIHCVESHGTIEGISIIKEKGRYVNAHPCCACEYVPMRTKRVGTATDWGMEGADAYIFYFGRLPDYYIDKDTAKLLGGKKAIEQFGSLFPGKMLGGAVYHNFDSKLPSAPGRTWYEADINYDGGKRNRHRLLYSNDGLMFATYDHYHTFYEMTK